MPPESSKPTEISIWDWRYRVAYDTKLAAEISEIAKSNARNSFGRILLDQLKIFSEIISVGQIIDDALTSGKCPVDPSSLSTKQLLHIPARLAKLYTTRIAGANNLSIADKQKLFSIINKAQQINYKNHHEEIFSTIFGNSMPTLVSEAKATPTPSVIYTPTIHFPKRNILTETMAILSNQKFKQYNNTPNSLATIPEYEVKIEPGAGYAEYWPTSLTGADNNRLVVYSNDANCDRNILQATLAHEILGHAVFYEFISKARPPLFDHGALCLIEGWATWCEWQFASADLRAQLRSTRCRALRRLDWIDTEKVIIDIEDIGKTDGYSKEQIDSTIEYHFQYPGFSQSYTLGAIWFESRFKHETPMKFWSDRTLEPVGDFFSLW